MLNNTDFWHVKLGEECNEVAHRCAKILQYGPEEVQDGHASDNADRLRDELLDLIAVIDLMQKAGAIAPISKNEMETAREAKRAKLRKYYNLSFELGRIQIGGAVGSP